MSNFVQITPFIHVPDIEAAITFFIWLRLFAMCRPAVRLSILADLASEIREVTFCCRSKLR